MLTTNVPNLYGAVSYGVERKWMPTAVFQERLRLLYKGMLMSRVLESNRCSTSTHTAVRANSTEEQDWCLQQHLGWAAKSTKSFSPFRNLIKVTVILSDCVRSFHTWIDWWIMIRAFLKRTFHVGTYDMHPCCSFVCENPIHLIAMSLEFEEKRVKSKRNTAKNTLSHPSFKLSVSLPPRCCSCTDHIWYDN